MSKPSPWMYLHVEHPLSPKDLETKYKPGSVTTVENAFTGTMNVVCECYHWFANYPTSILTHATVEIPPKATVVTPRESNPLRNQSYSDNPFDKRSLREHESYKRRADEAKVLYFERPTDSPFHECHCHQLGDSDIRVSHGETLKSPLDNIPCKANGKGI